MADGWETERRAAPGERAGLPGPVGAEVAAAAGSAIDQHQKLHRELRDRGYPGSLRTFALTDQLTSARSANASHI